MAARTLFQVLEDTARTYGDAPALHQPKEGGGYLTCSWNEYRDAALEIAAGLGALGIGKGEVIALDSETRLEFYLADLGILAGGMVAAALYPSYPAAELIRTIESTGAVAVFAEDPKTFEMLRPAAVRHWFLLTGEAPGALSLADLRTLGRQELGRDPKVAERIHTGTAPGDPAVLYLTSGATGEPKMALVTHQAITANTDMGPVVLPLGPHDCTVAFLPSAHIAQRIVMEYLPMASGMPVHFFESLLKLPQQIRKVRPTILLAPPRMWERVYATVCTELSKRPAPARKAFYGGLAVALAAARYRRQGKPVPLHLRLPLKLADRLLFHKVRARFGGRMRVAASGAAPLGKELGEFYEAIGMPVIEGYGLTEGGVATMNPLDAPRPGSIGKALPNVELKTAEDNELLVKSPCLFLGYWRDPAATAQVLRDGWLHTGDLAQIDSEGYVYMTGRKKELIVSSTGKKIYPARVESLFKLEPLVSQVLLIGDRLPYLTALFTLNPAAIETLKGMEPYRGLQAAELAVAPPVVNEMRRVVARVNKQLAPFEQVRKYRILARDFLIERGELTATMKVRRARAMENFKEDIEQLYAGRE